MSAAGIVIVGAGLAGAMAAAELRQHGYAGPLTLVGAEPHLPYDRPPLSKDVLLQADMPSCRLFPDGFFAERDITLRLGVAARALDADAGQLTLDNGETLAFAQLLLATGARARRLPLLDALGADLCHTLRTLDDAERLRAVLRPGLRVLLVGGGVIGMELAASVTERGAQAVVIECGDSIMARCAPPPLRDWLTAQHRQRGVQLHLGRAVREARRDGQTLTLTLDNGDTLSGDLLVYGVGAEPDTALAEQAGLRVAGGIVIDADSRTSHPRIFAAGDACCQLDAHGQPQRRETWESAKNQALAAVHAMLGLPTPRFDPPWFWTDQYGVNLQFAGDMRAPDWLLRGSLDDARAVWFGLDQGELIAAISINQGRDMRSLRQLIARRARQPAEVWQDPTRSLRELAR